MKRKKCPKCKEPMLLLAGEYVCEKCKHIVKKNGVCVKIPYRVERFK